MRAKKRDRWVMVSLLAGMGWLTWGCASQETVEKTGEGRGWHIVVKRCQGPNYDYFAGTVYVSLKQVRKLDANKVRKINFTDSAVVTYGHYASLDDPEAGADLKLIKSLMVPSQGYPFLDAHLEPVSEPDPPIDPSYVLASTKGVWTLHIGLFHGENRKQSAVELTRALRGEGVPAFVYHGPVKSMVTIGSYPARAVKETSRKNSRYGIKPVDPDLKKWKAEYPYMIINTGYARFRTMEGQKEKSGLLESLIIKVPRPGASLW